MSDQPSPVSSSCSPTAADDEVPVLLSPPWPLRADGSDPTADLAQLSYTQHDHDSYSKSSAGGGADSLGSLASDMSSCLSERLAAHNGKSKTHAMYDVYVC